MRSVTSSYISLVHHRVASGHLCQILDVDVDEVGPIVFKGLFGRDCFTYHLVNDLPQARHAFELEPVSDHSERDGGVDVFACDMQQVVARQISGVDSDAPPRK